ncbi:MAG: ABC transporter ATP-binding protein, partial [Eubacteriales bacterium]
MLSLLTKIIAFSQEQRKNLFLGIFLGFFKALFGMAHVIAIAFVMKNITDGTVTSALVWQSFGIIAFGVIGTIIFNYFSTMKLTNAGYFMAANSRIKIGDHLKMMSMGYFNSNNLGKITSVATNSAEVINDMLTRSVMLLAQGIFMSTIVALSMFYLDYRMGLMCLLGIAIYFMITAYQQKKAKSVSEQTISATQKLVNNILEYVQGISVVKSYNLVGEANTKVKNSINEANTTLFNMEKTFMPIVAFQSFIFKAVSFLMISLSIVFYINGSMELFTAVMMSICAFLIFSDLEQAGVFSSLLRLIAGSIDEINDILQAPLMDEQSEEIKVNNYDLEIKNIDFSYDTKKIIDNLSLTIPQNSTLAIVGGSGSGKTTLCNLITRFWDVDSGTITLGKQNIKDFKLDELLSQFSMVFQNVYLFNDTIANNVKFGKPNAKQSEIEDACKKACCHEFIMKLPNGYETIIGEGGASISGGEKQRISIARAMIKNSPIVILDEATANVDPENEHQLQLAIKELTKSKTVIMIAHRLKTVKSADNIIVLENGKIIETGKHDELLKNGSTYANFVNMREKAIGWKL